MQRVQPFCIRFGNFETAICITQTYIYDIRCIYTQIEVSTKSQERKNREEKKIKKYFIAQQFSSMTRDSDAQHTQNTCTYAIAHTELALWEHVDAAALFLLLAYVFFFLFYSAKKQREIASVDGIGNDGGHTANWSEKKCKHGNGAPWQKRLHAGDERVLGVRCA